jgi:hypothetical protein
VVVVLDQVMVVVLTMMVLKEVLVEQLAGEVQTLLHLMVVV